MNEEFEMTFLDNIIRGDCCAVLSKMPDECVDLTVTSPPYDELRDYKGHSFDFEGLARQLFRVTKKGGVVVWVVADQTKNFQESLTSFKQAIYFVEKAGFWLLDTMTYEKENLPPTYPGMMRYAPASEYMFVFTKGKPKTFNPIRDRPNKSAGKEYKAVKQRQKDGSLKPVRSAVANEFGSRFNVWRYVVGGGITNDKEAFAHPAMFPEKLANDHIISWSNEGDVVLDPMCGSGTTCKMALLNKRHYVGIEIAEEYVQIARERVEKARTELAEGSS